ncbi:MAG: LPS assembly lipoprotein LptE [Caulobacteraceae bacterium]
MNRPSLNRLHLLSLILLVSGALGGCGFTPLYATPGVGPALQSVAVVAPDGRAGFLVREQLEDALAHDQGAAARYRLTYTVSQNRYARGLRVNNIATGYELDLNVDYALTETGTGAVVYRGNAPVQVSYNSADAPYAGIAAQQDAEERAARQAAVLIRLDLSRYFSQLAAK